MHRVVPHARGRFQESGVDLPGRHGVSGAAATQDRGRTQLLRGRPLRGQ